MKLERVFYGLWALVCVVVLAFDTIHAFKVLNVLNFVGIVFQLLVLAYVVRTYSRIGIDDKPTIFERWLYKRKNRRDDPNNWSV